VKIIEVNDSHADIAGKVHSTVINKRYNCKKGNRAMEYYDF